MFEKLYNLFFNEGKDLEKATKDAFSNITNSYAENKKITPQQSIECLAILNKKVERHLKEERLKLQEQIDNLDSALDSFKQITNE